MSSDEPSLHISVANASEEAPGEGMGLGASKPTSRGIILSLDALGTLYRFRAPVAKQYLTIAQKCGLKAKVELPALEASFKDAFRSVSKEYPNYGKGKLPDPEAWWTELVTRSFKPIVKGEELPSDLGRSLYQHFSSGAAYELYPDVQPLLQRMREIRENPDSPTLLLGIVTNSDPRVKQVLESMSLKIGMSRLPSAPSRSEIHQSAVEDAEEYKGSGKVQVSLPWKGMWKAENDFDFLATSYDAESEKPDPEIMLYARNMARLLGLSKVVQDLPTPKSAVGGILTFATSAITHRNDVEDMTWVHVGDDYDKDIAPTKTRADIVPGMKAPKIHGIHLVREGEGTAVEGSDTVTSLIDVASIINLMVEDPNR